MIGIPRASNPLDPNFDIDLREGHSDKNERDFPRSPRRTMDNAVWHVVVAPMKHKVMAGNGYVNLFLMRIEKRMEAGTIYLI